MSSESKSCRVKVPASTSNLGSGFDTLGLAVQLYTTAELGRSQTGDVRVVPQPRIRACQINFRSGRPLFSNHHDKAVWLRVDVSSKVPVARGLG